MKLIATSHSRRSNKSILRAFLICFSLAWAANALSQTTIQEGGKQQNDNPAKGTAEKAIKNDSSHQELPPKLTEPIPKPKNQEPKSDGYEKHNWYDTFLDNPTEWLLSIFNGLLVLFTYRLWTATTGLRESAEETAERQLRAYLGIEGGFITLKESGSVNNIDINIVIKNTGQTPAYSVSVWCILQFADIQHFISHNLTEDITKERDSRSIIGSGTSMHIKPITLSLNADDLQKMKDGLMGFCVWGGIEYLDMFRKSKFVKFKIINGKYVPSKGWPLQDYKDGNDAD
ncbi:MAG: hypothetical protein PHD43_03555 [Methylococcales bacterium]|nr:hypothetical protein [Methylococcales bacterium]